MYILHNGIARKLQIGVGKIPEITDSKFIQPFGNLQRTICRYRQCDDINIIV